MNIDAPLISQITDLRSLWKEAFGDTEEFLNAFGSTAFAAKRCRCVTKDGKAAAALYWFDCLHMGGRVAYLYAVATAKEYRGQGLCHKLMEETHRHLARLGYEGAILVPGKRELFGLYESMGYRVCSHIREFRCRASAEDTRLCRIDKIEYAGLRRQLLPKGGVIQENENLDFLQTQAEFYAGSGFLLAADGEGDVLHCMELLGDVTAAPGIVKKLGYNEGIFRTPGEGVPFAMYRPTKDSELLPPAYFGLAFD